MCRFGMVKIAWLALFSAPFYLWTIVRIPGNILDNVFNLQANAIVLDTIDNVSAGVWMVVLYNIHGRCRMNPAAFSCQPRRSSRSANFVTFEPSVGFPFLQLRWIDVVSARVWPLSHIRETLDCQLSTCVHMTLASMLH
jgi:hypothetical protein